MEKIFGTLASLSSLGIALIGLPKQIWHNYRWKSTKGLEPHLVYSVLAAYLFWWLYGISKADWFLILSQFPGFALSFILAFQIWRYK
jgi:uncharacterized protein with PQ loop repeat